MSINFTTTISTNTATGKAFIYTKDGGTVGTYQQEVRANDKEKALDELRKANAEEMRVLTVDNIEITKGVYTMPVIDFISNAFELEKPTQYIKGRKLMQRSVESIILRVLYLDKDFNTIEKEIVAPENIKLSDTSKALDTVNSVSNKALQAVKILEVRQVKKLLAMYQDEFVKKATKIEK